MHHPLAGGMRRILRNVGRISSTQRNLRCRGRELFVGIVGLFLPFPLQGPTQLVSLRHTDRVQTTLESKPKSRARQAHLPRGATLPHSPTSYGEGESIDEEGPFSGL